MSIAVRSRPLATLNPVILLPGLLPEISPRIDILLYILISLVSPSGFEPETY
jgi:hypothetical protein